MGKQQHATTAPDLKCVIRHPGRFKESQKDFDAIVEFVRGLLKEAAFTGTFHVLPIQPTRGSAANKTRALRFTGEDSKGALIFTIQLGSNDAAWKCKLYPPEGESLNDVRDKVARALEQRRSKRTHNAVEANPFVVAAVEDTEAIALMLAPLFPLAQSEAGAADVIAAFKEQYVWSGQHAHEALTLLEARNQVELSGTNGSSVVRVKPDSSLASILISLDALTEHRSGTLTDQLESLTTQALGFSEAQSFLATTATAHAAVAARLERAREELKNAETAAAELEEKRSAASRIVADPAYAAAATKMQQIRAIIGSPA
jgi:hypothetical protein